MAATDPHEDPSSIWVSLTSYAINDERGTPVTIRRGERHRGGPRFRTSRSSQWGVEDGATDREIGEAPAHAGVLY